MQVRTVQRAFAVMEALNDTGLLNVAKISKLAGISRSTTKRILDTLQNEGYVKRDSSTRLYWLTERTYSLSRGYRERDLLRESIKRHARVEFSNCKWPVTLARLRKLGLEVLFTTSNEAPFSLNKFRIGSKLPMIASASGYIVLASLSRSHLRILLRDQLQKTGKPEEFGRVQAEIERAYLDQFAIHRCPGARVKSMAVPIVKSGQVIATISTDFICSIVSDTEAKSDLLPRLNVTAEKVSRDIQSYHECH